VKLSERLARLGTETAFEVLVRARALEAQGRSVIHLEIGEPDFDTPSHITDAAVEALKGGATHYGPAPGLPELRQAIAEDSTARRGVKATPEMVVVTPGGKPIMFYVILALIDAGDEVLYPNPGFPIYESMIRYIGGVPVPVRLLEEKAYALDVDQLIAKITPKTKLIVLNYPPTGGRPTGLAVRRRVQHRIPCSLTRSRRSHDGSVVGHAGWTRSRSCSTASRRRTP
jgi:aspartate/methionine/tyrosine aminotransferase